MSEVAPFVKDPALDATLCLAYQSGQRALNDLVERHKAMVHDFANKMHFQSGVDRDDVIQSGMIALTHAAAKWKDDGRSQFGSYAWICVWNAMRRSAGQEALKACSLNKHPLDEAGGEILDLLPCPEPPELPVDVRERVQRLPSIMRKVVILRWGLDGEPLNWGEVAKLTGLTVVQAKRAEELALSKV